MKHISNALEEMIKKDVDGGELDAVEHVIFWVWDDETGERIEAAERAAELYAQKNAELEQLRATEQSARETAIMATNAFNDMLDERDQLRAALASEEK